MNRELGPNINFANLLQCQQKFEKQMTCFNLLYQLYSLLPQGAHLEKIHFPTEQIPILK